jgi:hypothetical protein
MADSLMLPEKLFHATYKVHLDSIMKHGLDSSRGKKNWSDSAVNTVYLADSPESAESYAETSELIEEDNEEWLDEIVILEIETRHLDITKISQDKNVIYFCGTFEHIGVIEPEFVKIYKPIPTQSASPNPL